MKHTDKSEQFFIKLQKNNNCYNPSSIRKFVATEFFLNKLQQSYDSYDADPIKNLLSSDFVYESFFEFNIINGKSDYMNYLSHKLKKMKEFNYKEKLELLYNSDTGEQVLIFVDKSVPKQDGEYVCFVATANDAGLIDRLVLTLTSFYDSLFLPKDALEDLENIEVDVDDDILPSFLVQTKQ